MNLNLQGLQNGSFVKRKISAVHVQHPQLSFAAYVRCHKEGGNLVQHIAAHASYVTNSAE